MRSNGGDGAAAHGVAACFGWTSPKRHASPRSVAVSRCRTSAALPTTKRSSGSIVRSTRYRRGAGRVAAEVYGAKSITLYRKGEYREAIAWGRRSLASARRVG